MSVVGFDFGTHSCYIAVARAGGIETIANEYSDRCTPSYLSLNEKNRCMGVSARNQNTTNCKNTISVYKKLIGRKLNDPQVQYEINKMFQPYEIVSGRNGETLIQAHYMGEKQQFTPEQIAAMLLTKLKETAEVALKTKVVDVVVSVPSFFTDKERRSMIESCQIAGLNCLRLMNDTTAAALAYGIYKQDLPAENESARNVIFVDMGYSSLQVAAVSYNKGKLKVLAVTSDSNLGGRDFDKVLADHFISEFITRFKLDATTNPKSMVRLYTECEKMKKVMSSNSQSIPLNIECFMNDVDVSAHLDRAAFEEMSADLLTKTEAVFKQIITLAKLSKSDIYSVEIVGGATRIPAVKNLVTEVFGMECSTTLNADEATARGCALQCAILSPTFRVRDFSIQDCQPYPITINYTGGFDEGNSMEVFPAFHQAPFSKMLTFFRKEPFSISACYTNPKQVPQSDPNIGTFKISKIVPQSNGESVKVKVKVRVDINGIFKVVQASMIEKLEVQEEEAKPEQESMEVDQDKKDGVPGETPVANDTAANGETTTDEAPMQTDPTEQSQPNAEQTQKDKDAATTEESSDTKQEEKEETDKKGKKKKSVKTTDLPIEYEVGQLSKDELHCLLEKENHMIMQDKLEKERADSKNSVEEYVYEMREKVFGPLEDFCKEEDRETYSRLLGETEEWLYEEGDDQSKQVYIDKLEQLKKIGQPIVDRYRESQERPRAFEALGSSLQMIRKFLTQCEQKDEKYSHLETSDIEKVQKCLKEKTEWFDNQQNIQASKKKYEDVQVYASQIRQTKEFLEATCNPVLNKPKPKPKEEPPKEEPKDKKTEEKNEEGSGDSKATPESNPPPSESAAKPQTNDMDID